MADQPTLVIIKPDGLKKSLTGNILTRLSETKLTIIAAKITSPTRQLAEAHYQHLKAKPFFDELVRYLMGELHTPRVMALVYYGEDAVAKVRKMCGATNPEEADPASIRGSYGRITTKGVFENVLHASGAVDEAEREIKLWFQPDEICIVDNLFPSKQATVQKTARVWA